MDGGTIVFGLAITGIIFLAIKLATPMKVGNKSSENLTENNKIENKGYIKICVGIATIILSPLIGTLLYYLYSSLIGTMMRTDSAVDMFWFSCIFTIVISGLAIVLVGCNEKLIQHRNQANSKWVLNPIKQGGI